MEDSLREILEGEVDFMRSAYGDDFVDIREKDVWKVARAPEVLITLGPHHSQGGTLHTHIRVVLRINTTEQYPDHPATVSLESCEGLSEKEGEELTNQLRVKARQSAQEGMVVMLDLCQLAQNFLSEHARPFTSSIYDEMMAGQESRRKASEEAKEESRRQQMLKEEAHRTVMQGEIARVKEELKAERQKKGQKFRQYHLSDSSSEKGDSMEGPCSPGHKQAKCRSLSECSSDNASVETLIQFPLPGKQERTVAVLGCLGERHTQGCCVYEAQEKGSTEKCVLYSWHIKPKRTGKKGNHIKVGQETQFQELIGKFSVLEKEMSSLLRLSHENLVPYLAMKVDQRHNNGILVYVLQEYVRGMSLKYYLEQKIPMNLPLVKHIAKGTLQALHYLHKNNVVHRDLRDSCIYFDSCCGQVKVSDFGAERRIIEVILEFGGCEAPSMYPLSPGRGGKKGDVYRLGLIVLSLYKGDRIQKIIPVLPSALNADFQDFLQQCLVVNEQERWAAEQLLSHNFLNNKLKENENLAQSPEGNNAGATSVESGHKDEEEDSGEGRSAALPASFKLPSNLVGHSRLQQEYEVLDYIGQGGFGHVLKVRNTVDDRIYALKRIQLDQQSEAVRKKIIREVKLLSSLNHENVVRYYTSWIDKLYEDPEASMTQREEDDTTDSSSFPEASTAKSVSVDPNSSSAWKATDSSDESTGHSERKDGDTGSSIVFYDHQAANFTSAAFDDDTDEDEDDEEDWLMGSLRPMLKEEDDETDTVDFRGGEEQISVMTDGVTSAPPVKLKMYQFLYIQMQLCEKSTLRQAINKGLYLDDDRMWRLFREMVNGLDYIHSQGLIHRDLKPGNVFLDSADHVKIGDFGLATAAIKAKTTIVMSKTDYTDDSCLTGQVGTTLYIAPEVKKSTGKINYTSKVDIYSLGIIFFEMTYPPLTTGMERVKVLSDIRKPEVILPDDVPKRKNTSCSELIRWLLLHDPQQRPSTTDILKSPLLPPPTAEEQKFVATLEAKLQNVRSSDYQEILNLIFKPSASTPLEATFELNQDKSARYWDCWKLDYLRSLFVAVFKAHGAIWIPTLFYIPKGSFYNDKDNLVSLMARRGELVSAQYDLRYPFARTVARDEIKSIRRYAIDRVQRSSKVTGIHPKESYECAFDIVSPKRESLESCARIMLVAQDIILKIMQRRNQEPYVRVGHMDLVHGILTYCEITETLHPSVYSALKDWNANRIATEVLPDHLSDLGVSKSSCESLRGFLYIDGPLKEIVTSLQNKCSGARRKNLVTPLKQVLAILQEIGDTAITMGLQFDIRLRPLMVADAEIYCGFMCQFLMDVWRKKTTAQDLLAQGGSYKRLIEQHRNKLVSQKTGEVPNAVGVSLFLEKFVSCLEDVSELLVAGGGDPAQLVSGLGCGSSVLSVMVCAIAQKQLKERVQLVKQLRAAKITADHCFCLTQKEAESALEDSHASTAVILTSTSKADVRILHDPVTGRALERKIPLDGVEEFILKNLGVKEAAPVSFSNKADAKPASLSTQDSGQPNIQYITKKQSRSRDAPKLDMQITREVQALSARWPCTSPGSAVDVWAVEVDKKILMALGSLDTDSSVKNFTESMNDIKNMFADQKDYIEEICKMIQKKVFSKKKTEQPVPLVLYSIASNACKRIL